MGDTSKTKEVGELRFVVRKLRPRKAFVGLAHLTRAIGPAVAEVIAAGGIQVGPHFVSLVQAAGIAIAPGEGGEDLSALIRGVIAKLIESIETVEPEKLLELVDHLLCGHLAIERVDGDTLSGREGDVTRIEIVEGPLGAAMLDEHVGDVWTLIGLVRVAIELNFLPTSPAAQEPSAPGKRRARKGT